MSLLKACPSDWLSVIQVHQLCKRFVTSDVIDRFCYDKKMIEASSSSFLLVLLCDATKYDTIGMRRSSNISFILNSKLRTDMQNETVSVWVFEWMSYSVKLLLSFTETSAACATQSIHIYSSRTSWPIFSGSSRLLCRYFCLPRPTDCA